MIEDIIGIVLGVTIGLFLLAVDISFCFAVSYMACALINFLCGFALLGNEIIAIFALSFFLVRRFKRNEN